MHSCLNIISIRKISFKVGILFIFLTNLNAQIKIGENPTIIHPDAILEIESQNKGLLLPRLALVHSSDPSPLSAHLMGMAAYNVAISGDLQPGFYFNDGSKWVRLAGYSNVSNGIQIGNTGNLILGGNLDQPTTIGTSPSNTIAITGLETVAPDNYNVVMLDPTTGILYKSPPSLITKQVQLLHIASDGQTQFNTPLQISDIDKLEVYRNGVRIGAAFVNPNTIELESGVIPVSGDEIRIVQIN